MIRRRKGRKKNRVNEERKKKVEYEDIEEKGGGV